MTIEVLTAFFGWLSVLNVGFLVLATVFLACFKNFALKTHNNIFNVDEASLHRIYFIFMAFYKLLIIVFALTPYMALKFVTYF